MINTKILQYFNIFPLSGEKKPGRVYENIPWVWSETNFVDREREKNSYEGACSAEIACEAEITELNYPAGGNEDVAWIDVAVHDILPVDVRHGFQEHLHVGLFNRLKDLQYERIFKFYPYLAVDFS